MLIAAVWDKQDLSTLQTSFREEHLSLAISLKKLAVYLLYIKEAMTMTKPNRGVLFLQALGQRKRLLEEKHPFPLFTTSLKELARLYYYQGRHDQAKELLVEALEQKKRLLKKKHPFVATSLNNLAVYYSQGRYDQEEELLVEALGQRKGLLGEEHPFVTTSLNNLAVYYSQGCDQEEELLVEALGEKKRLLGEEHPSIVTSLNNLASFYDFQRRYDEAERLYLQALAVFKHLLETYPEC